MAIQIPYNGDTFNFSVNHDDLIPEVQMDVFEYGEDYEVYAICKKKTIKVPFIDDYVDVKYVEDYQLDVEDLVDLQEDEYAVKTTLWLLLQKLKQEDSLF